MSRMRSRCERYGVMMPTVTWKETGGMGSVSGFGYEIADSLSHGQHKIYREYMYDAAPHLFGLRFPCLPGLGGLRLQC